MEPVSLVIIGACGAAALIIRELIWLRFCRKQIDQGVARGHNPDPVQLIQAARGGRLQQAAEQVRQAITGKPPEKN